MNFSPLEGRLEGLDPHILTKYSHFSICSFLSFFLFLLVFISRSFLIEVIRSFLIEVISNFSYLFTGVCSSCCKI